MALTIKNYTKELAKEQLQAAEKSIVRECDETEKGIFVAYVDEGNESFDASLTLSANGQITKSICDCGSSPAFCRHRVALLIHISKGKKVVGGAKIIKKESNTETLLEQVEFDALKEWVKTLIQKNKDIEFSFVSRFSVKKQYHTPNEVIKLVNDALKAAGCSKKKADASQIKKLVELLSEVLQPVVEYYEDNVTDEQAFQSFHVLVDQCVYLHSAINSSSVRIARYVEDILKKSEVALGNLQHDESWLLAASYFVRHITTPSGAIKIQYAVHLKNVANSADQHKREKLINMLVEQFKMLSSEDRLNWAVYAKIVFNLVKDYSPSPENYKIFRPLRFENEFNEELIRILVANNQLELAQKYCKAQIAANYQEQYNIPYLKILKDIYTIQNDEVNLAHTLKELFPWTFDFNAYLFVAGRMEADEKKKWRTRVLSRARNAIHSYHYGALEFCFQLMDHEKSYKKMIDYIDSYTPYDIILKYFEPMAATEKSRLLDAIIRKSDSQWYLYTNKVQDDDSCFPALFDLTEKYYSADYLRMVIKQLEKGRVYYYRPNRFIVYMKRQLGE